MHEQLSVSLIRNVLAGILALTVLNGCTAHRQNRTDFQATTLLKYQEQFPEPADDPGGNRQKESRKLVANKVFEDYEDFLIAHVEFDDQGQFWETTRKGGTMNQLDALEDQVRNEIEADRSRYKNGAVIVVFVHGWNNNSEEGNGNLDSFRKSMAEIAGREEHGRRIIGVYLSWRGLRVKKIPVATAVPGFLTYWDRKETAENIGKRTMGETLKRLSFLKNEIVENGEKQNYPNARQRRKYAQSRLVLVGHSFGGAAVYSGVSRFFEDELLKFERSGYSKYIGRAWDLVVLVNPAFEAMLYATIHRYSSKIPEKTNPYGQLPRMLVIGAENDRATGAALPVGQALGDLFRPKQQSEHLDQGSQMSTALGHYEPFMTHRLRKDPADGLARLEPYGDPKDPNSKGAHHRMAAYEPGIGQDYLRDFSELFRQDAKVKRVFPFMVVQADKDVVDGHNGIWQKELSQFIMRFIDAREVAVRSLNRKSN